MDGIAKKLNKYDNRKRRGAGAIIGGVILAAILLTTVLVYFMTILNNEKTRTGLEIRAQQESREKGTETYQVDRALTVVGGNMDIAIVNKGPISMVASHALVYCESGCIEPPSEPIQTMAVSKVLNSGDSVPESTGGGLLIADNNHRYRIDVISERGNIVSSIVCTVKTNGTCLEDSDAGGAPPCIECVVTEGIIQGTGSIQLDFKSFGAIYPNMATRNGIDQTGWSVKSGNATGYPAYSIPKLDRVVLVERMRNFDISKDDLTLASQTGLSVTLGKSTGNNPSIIYVCKGTPGAPNNPGTIAPYDDSKALPYTGSSDGKYANFQDVFFCSVDEQRKTVSWDPASDAKFDGINGVFMVARGFFGAKSDIYAQTIPYQSILISNTVNVCLKTIIASNSLACPANEKTIGNNVGYIYSATQAQMQGPLSVKLRLETTTHPPYNVEWVYSSSGKHTTLTPPGGATPVAGHIQFTLPQKMEDGVMNIQPGFYTIIVASDYYKVTSGGKDTYQQDIAYMTFRVT